MLAEKDLITIDDVTITVVDFLYKLKTDKVITEEQYSKLHAKYWELYDEIKEAIEK